MVPKSKLPKSRMHHYFSVPYYCSHVFILHYCPLAIKVVFRIKITVSGKLTLIGALLKKRAK